MLDDQRSPESAVACSSASVDNEGTRCWKHRRMIMVQLGVPLADAMVRIRAYAYAHNKRLNDVAADIVAGKLVLEPDAP